MSHNLLESQKEALRWIVREVRADNLPEEEIPFSWSMDGLAILSRDVDPPDIEMETVKALRDERLLRAKIRERGFYLVSLTPNAYEAVDQMEQWPSAVEAVQQNC